MTLIEPDEPVISILYVEDEQDTREVFRKIICYRFPEIRLHVAENGKIGFEVFKRFQPEIVITDINMPHCNGISMAEKIKMLCPATVVIALTAHSDSKYLMQAIELGISNYLLKPLDVEKLFGVIGNTVAMIKSERTIQLQNSRIAELNKELARKAAELELANRELESFDYTVAHDLRSPLVNISTFSRVLLDAYADNLDNTGKTYLLDINREAMRMNELICALLRFSVYSRKFVGKKWVNLTSIASEIRDTLLGQTSGRKVTFRIAENVKGYGDPELLKIVLENLLGNAWKYSAMTADTLIEFDTINQEEDLVYYVRDNGAGFDQQCERNLFLPFQRFQCNEDIDGFGIGLATASRIILRHGGKIWAEGKEGKGATFYFTL